MTTTKRRYPKSFYDEGLADILEWIDDEVLVHSDKKSRVNLDLSDDDTKDVERPSARNKVKKEKPASNSEDNKLDAIKLDKKHSKLYGENDISSDKLFKPSRKKFIKLDDDFEVQVDKKLEDRVRGLINRLAAQTMGYVTSEFEKLYSSHARNCVTQAIFNNIKSAVISELSITKRKLVAELMLLVSYLSSKISLDIGAYVVHMLISSFEHIYTRDNVAEGDKRLNNVTYCIVNLYMIGLIGSSVIFEFAKRIYSYNFTPKSVELLLLITRSVGFQLRRDSPQLMRQLIVAAHEQSRDFESNSEVGSRVQFMTETLAAIKNNNMSKIVNYGSDIDKDTIESCLKALFKRTKLPETLSEASYQEILNSPNWYLLETQHDEIDVKNRVKDSLSNPQVSHSLDNKVCKALGLNKSTEKTVFGALIRASDHIEASNLMIGFGLNYCSDVMIVCLHVAIHEKKYNPFHYEVINSLCKFNRKYKIAAKFSTQDKIRTLGHLSPQRVIIFQRLSFELVKSNAIPITILKSIEWSNLNEGTKGYLTYLLHEISKLPEDEKRLN